MEIGHNERAARLGLLADDAAGGLSKVANGEVGAIEGWLIYGAALNEGRTLFDPEDDKSFGQWVKANLLSQVATVEITRDERAAAMWAAKDRDRFEDARANCNARTVRGIYAKWLEDNKDTTPDLDSDNFDGDEWYTPAWVFESLGLIFDMDVCGPADREHVSTPAREYFTESDDGLAQRWHGLVWCNPPYSNAAPWAERMIEHGNGILLTHIPMNAKWCSDVWQRCDGIRLFQAMVFVRPDGSEQRPGYWLQMAAFGDVAREALREFTTPNDVAENPRRVPSPMWIIGS